MVQQSSIDKIFTDTKADRWFKSSSLFRTRNAGTLSFCKPKSPEVKYTVCENDMIFSDRVPTLATIGSEKTKWERNPKSIIITLVSIVVVLLGDIINSLPIYGFLFDRTVNFVVDLICFAAEFLLFGPFALLSLPKFYAFFTTTPPLSTLIIEIIPWNLIVIIARGIWRRNKNSSVEKGVEMVFKEGITKGLSPVTIYNAIYPERAVVYSPQPPTKTSPIMVAKNSKKL